MSLLREMPVIALSIAILIGTEPNALAASGPMSPAQIALYQGADREKILIEGAKREGQFTLYTSHTPGSKLS